MSVLPIGLIKVVEIAACPLPAKSHAKVAKRKTRKQTKSG